MVKSVGAAGLERIELRRLTERIGQLFQVLQEAADAQLAEVPGAWIPPVDICETANAICVRIELPGITASQIRVGLNGNKLRICGEKKKRDTRKRMISHVCSERSYGRFDRVVRIPWAISVENAKAELSRGVLLVHLPKLKDRRGSEFKITISEIE